MWLPMPAPAGRNDDSAPARRSAQSLGRNVLPSRVMPWILNRRGVATGTATTAADGDGPCIAAPVAAGTACCGKACTRAPIVP
jgi:hypothetical protein